MNEPQLTRQQMTDLFINKLKKTISGLQIEVSKLATENIRLTNELSASSLKLKLANDSVKESQRLLDAMASLDQPEITNQETKN